MMDHPNIAKVLDAGTTDTGRPYFVMELVKGVAITRYCDDNQLTTRERLHLFIQVCQAIQHPHQKGIIHRDIKPSNTMVALQDGVPVPRIIDFGIAKATGRQLTDKPNFTQYGQFIGTPVYMSPEQAEAGALDVDTRSDIYSLGVVLYELLVGRTPLDGRALLAGGYEEIRRRIQEEEPTKPSTKASSLEIGEKATVARQRGISPNQLENEFRGDLDSIVLKALEKDRDRRYETASGLALDLKRYLANEPVTAVVPSVPYVLRKYMPRHRAGLTVAAGIAGILVAATSISTRQAIRAARASQAEKEQRVTTEHLLYAANIALAQQAWEQNQIPRVRQLLDETADHPERGFEWYYWQPGLDRQSLGRV